MSQPEPGNVARGLKSAISNPNNSEEAKANAEQKLEQLEADGELGDSAHQAQVKTGHKAAISNPNNSEQAKEHSKKKLQQNDTLL